MEIIILILFGLIASQLVSKNSLNKGWNLALGILGALVFGLLDLNLKFQMIAFLMPILGATMIINFGNFLKSVLIKP